MVFGVCEEGGILDVMKFLFSLVLVNVGYGVYLVFGFLMRLKFMLFVRKDGYCSILLKVVR